MLIKNKRLGLKTVVLVLLAVVLSFFTLNSERLKIQGKEDIVQYVMSMDLGFSNRVNLVDQGEGIFTNGMEEGFRSYQELILPSVISAIPKIVSYKIADDNFERIDIDIKYIDYQKIMQDRDRAIKKGVMSYPTVVNARIKFLGETYKAKLRLKGNLESHWGSRRRMSFRINLKEGTIFGNSKFSLQKPSARQFPYDHIFQSMMRDVGNLASFHNYIHVYVNGTDWGIMDMEEHISKEFLEKQKRRNSSIVRFLEEKSWLNSRFVSTYHADRIGDPSLYVHLFNRKSSLKDYQFRKMYSYISKHRIDLNSFLYDIDSFTKAYILATAWNDWHTLAETNTRYYFNPYTLKLEPITSDEGGVGILNNTEDIRFHTSSPLVYRSILPTQSFVDRLPKNLSNINKVVSKTQRYFDDTGLIFPVDRKKSGKVLIDNMNKITSNSGKYLTDHFSGDTYKRNKKIELPTYKEASDFIQHLHIRHYTDGTLELYNLLPDNVTVKDILFNGKSFSNTEIIVPSYLSNPEPVVIKTPYLGIQDNMFTVNTEYQSFDRIIKNDITLVSNGIDNPLLLDTAHEFDFINKLDDKVYEIKDGKWVVDKPIIVEGDLHISPGTNLQFSKDAYIIVKGALTAIGGVDNPITLKAVSDSWKGIYVLNSSKKSHIKNVNISNISALEDELLKLTGGITFYKSNVDFDNIRINDVKAEDAINIVESSFSLNSVFIDNTVSDGLDSDFSKGDIMDSEFSHIGGDALDFSGSNVSIRRTQATNVKDKAVSAGEKSILNIKDSNFDTIGVGVASKDGSSVTITDTKISNYKLYAAMSYLKKDFYDMPSINLNNCLVSEGNAYIRQKGTSMIVDNHNIPESEVSVKKLYKTRVMMK